MTAPLTPPECDLRGLDYMPMSGDRIMDGLFLASTAEEFKAAMALRFACWRQVPAASLPNDDRVLAGLARVTTGRWARVKAVALNGFVLCDDGRFYHPDVAAHALRAWDARQAQQAKARARWDKPRQSAGSFQGSAADDAAASPQDMQERGRGRGKVSASSLRSETAADEPPPSDLPEQIHNPDARAWADAESVLTATGCSREEARRFFGLLLKKYDLDARDMLPPLASTIANSTRDPRSYLSKAAEGIAQRRGGRGKPAEPICL